jgi:hypothetical protein
MKYKTPREHSKRSSREASSNRVRHDAESKRRAAESIIKIDGHLKALRNAGSPGTIVFEKQSSTKSRIKRLGAMATGKEIVWDYGKNRKIIHGTTSGYVVAEALNEAYSDGTGDYVHIYDVGVSTDGSFFKVNEKAEERGCVVVEQLSFGDTSQGISEPYYPAFPYHETLEYIAQGMRNIRYTLLPE